MTKNPVFDQSPFHTLFVTFPYGTSFRSHNDFIGDRNTVSQTRRSLRGSEWSTLGTAVEIVPPSLELVSEASKQRCLRCPVLSTRYPSWLHGCNLPTPAAPGSGLSKHLHSTRIQTAEWSVQRVRRYSCFHSVCSFGPPHSVVPHCLSRFLPWRVSSATVRHKRFKLSSRPAPKTPQDSKTPPAEQILSSYQGQTVTTVEIAGRPDLQTAQFEARFAQKQGQPFDKEKVDATAAALKGTGQFQDVRTHAVISEAWPPACESWFVLRAPPFTTGSFSSPAPSAFPTHGSSRSRTTPRKSRMTPRRSRGDRQRLILFFRQEGCSSG